jgi:hypothetical protein
VAFHVTARRYIVTTNHASLIDHAVYPIESYKRKPLITNTMYMSLPGLPAFWHRRPLYARAREQIKCRPVTWSQSSKSLPIRMPCLVQTALLGRPQKITLILNAFLCYKLGTKSRYSERGVYVLGTLPSIVTPHPGQLVDRTTLVIHTPDDKLCIRSRMPFPILLAFNHTQERRPAAIPTRPRVDCRRNHSKARKK